ncbi:peptidase inhibitor family I36 protein [Saccharothrix obliqua]|uniref:peptidase inhibitor family I36 protein n=1 Tax=Saccharothrix obliqua TaxID=2861747 RepID=UPI001C5F8797|nr:peptidase inhibitor family I36 protein [Saccharothrix obliqua]MBW4718720.1 peptidase inhibitor family I36 protein [Saccharothrix obliqua]
MKPNAIRLAAVVPAAVLAAALAPAAHAATDPAATDPAATDYAKCPAKNVCAYAKSRGAGEQWAKHQSQRRNHNLPWAGRSVYNRTDKVITFHRLPDGVGRRFTLKPGQRSDFAGGAPMDHQVWSITIP